MSKFLDKYTERTHPIELDDVTFHVVLPTQDNKRFKRGVVGETYVIDDNGEPKRIEQDISQLAIAQITAFVKLCVRKVDGWPEYSVDALLAMPNACEQLWDEAISMANAQEAEANAAVKKPVPILDGPVTGPDEADSINSLKTADG